MLKVLSWCLCIVPVYRMRDRVTNVITCLNAIIFVEWIWTNLLVKENETSCTLNLVECGPYFMIEKNEKCMLKRLWKTVVTIKLSLSSI